MNVSISTDGIIITERKGTNFRWLTLPTVTDVLFVMLLATLTIVGSQRMFGDGDPGCHIKTGEYILNNWTLPKEDPFSFTMEGKRWFAWEWLSDVIFAWIHGMLGLNGVVAFCNLIVAVAFCFLFRMLLSRQVNILIALSLVLAALGASFLHWLARPHIVSWLFTLITYWWLDEYQQSRKKYIYFLPLLMLVWVNLHGGFMIGLILTSIYLLGNLLTFLTQTRTQTPHRCTGQVTDVRQQTVFLAFIWLISLFASFINPYGLKLIPHIVDTYVGKNLIVDTTYEFMSPNFHDNTVKLFELCIILMIIVLNFSNRRFNFIQIGLSIFWLHMALFSSRNIPLFLIVITPIIGEHLNDILNQLQRRTDIKAWVKKIIERFFLISRRLRNLEPGTNSPVYFVIPTVIMVLLCLNGGRIGSRDILSAQFDSKRFPVDAANFIETNQIPGKMFNEFAWGGYLIYRLYPSQKVFIDGRADMYGEPFVKDYLEVIQAGKNWSSVLEKNDINWAIIPTSSPIATVLFSDDRWRHVYKDDVATIFIRQTGMSDPPNLSAHL